MKSILSSLLLSTAVAAGLAAADTSEPDPFGSAPPESPPTTGGSNDEPDPFSIPAKPKEPEAMNNRRLGALIESIDPNPEGQTGFWRFEVKGTELICVTDERADRMRVMSPIARIEDVSAEELAECMKANFDRALDARYCVDGGVLYGAFIHPLRELTPGLFLSAVEQVYNVKATFGTTYTSGALIFQGEDENERKGEKADEAKKRTRA